VTVRGGGGKGGDWIKKRKGELKEREEQKDMKEGEKKKRRFRAGAKKIAPRDGKNWKKRDQEKNGGNFTLKRKRQLRRQK